jgi:hypothetical protein
MTINDKHDKYPQAGCTQGKRSTVFTDPPPPTIKGLWLLTPICLDKIINPLEG